MTDQTKYQIQTDTQFEPLQLVDIHDLVRQVDHPWFNQTLCGVNDCVVRLGIFSGGREFHWHKHDHEDEFFFVLEGTFEIDLEGQTVKLGPHQGFTVPRGVMHMTRSPERAVVLMVEGATVQPTGDL